MKMGRRTFLRLSGAGIISLVFKETLPVIDWNTDFSFSSLESELKRYFGKTRVFDEGRDNKLEYYSLSIATPEILWKDEWYSELLLQSLTGKGKVTLTLPEEKETRFYPGCIKKEGFYKGKIEIEIENSKNVRNLLILVKYPRWVAKEFKIEKLSNEENSMVMGDETLRERVKYYRGKGENSLCYYLHYMDDFRGAAVIFYDTEERIKLEYKMKTYKLKKIEEYVNINNSERISKIIEKEIGVRNHENKLSATKKIFKWVTENYSYSKTDLLLKELEYEVNSSTIPDIIENSILGESPRTGECSTQSEVVRRLLEACEINAGLQAFKMSSWIYGNGAHHMVVAEMKNKDYENEVILLDPVNKLYNPLSLPFFYAPVGINRAILPISEDRDMIVTHYKERIIPYG